MSLFEAASRQFVKDTGRLSLHPAPDLNSAIYCRILCVVEKKKSRFFWKKPKYLPTPFNLNDLLGQTDGGTKQTIDVSSKSHKSVFITGYQNNPQFHVKGKLGAKIASEFDMDTSSSDSFTVNMNVGSVTRNEVRWEDLHDALAGKTIDLDHDFMQKIMGSNRRSLYLIHEMLCTVTNDTKLDKDTEIEGDADVQTETKTSPIFSVNVSGSATDSHHRSFDIPKDTVLGFACYKLLINDETGELDIECVRDVTDAPQESQVPSYNTFDEPDGQDKALVAFFKPILKSPNHVKFVDCFKKILVHPQTIEPLRTLLENALHAVNNNKEGATPYRQFKSQVPSGSSGWQELLLLLQFSVDEKADTICFPVEDASGTLLCCTGFAEALVELSESQCQALRQITPEYFEPLLYVLKNTLYGRPPVSSDDPQIRGLWTHSANPAKTLLLSLGFAVVTQENKKVLKFQGDPSLSLEDVYVSVFGLCS